MDLVPTEGETGSGETILVLAKDAAEKELICRVAGEAGFGCQVAPSMEAFCAAVEQGRAAVGVVAQEALAGRWLGRLTSALERQPAEWELPLVIVMRPGALAPCAVPAAVRGLRTATLLERPLRAGSLAGALHAGVRLSRQQAALHGAAEREKLIRQLQADRELLDLAQAAGNIGIFEWRVDERRIAVSAQLAAMCGLPPAALNVTLEDFAAWLHPEDRERVLRHMNSVAAGTGDPDLEFRIAVPQGPARWLQIRGRRIGGDARRIAGVVIDITERKRAEQEREGRLDRIAGERIFLQQILDRMPMAVVLAEAPSGRIFFQNRRVAEILRGAPPQSYSVEDYGVWPLYRPDGTPYAPAELPMARTVRKGEAIIGEEMRLRAEDGAWVHVSVNSAPIRDSAGNVAFGVLVMDDVTQRGLAEEALRKSESTLARGQRIAHLGDWERDLVTGALHWSDEVFRIFGFEPRAFVPSYEMFLERVHPEDRAAVVEHARKAIERGEPYRLDHRIILPDGSVKFVSEYGEAARDSSGRPVALIGAVLDITERKRAEDARRESEERFLAFMDHSPNTAWAKDEDGRYVYINAAYEKRYGVRQEDWLGKTDYDLWPEESARQFLKNDAEVLARGDSTNLFERVPNPDGTYSDFWTFKFPFRDAAGKRYVGGMGIDVTERQLMEERLRQAQKMESVGLLAGGVAHDFNNLLAGILGFASLLKDEVPPESVRKVNFIADAAERAADLTRQLLAYAGKGRFVLEPVDVGRVAREMVDLIKASISKKISVELDLDADVPPVEADRGQIQQIVMNLLLNAAEAIGENQAGAIRVTTRDEEITTAGATFDALSGDSLSEGRYVSIEVRDTGCGMSPETLAKIFDPFFTTKFMGRGLGLAAVAGVVKAHRGGIAVASSPGAGTAFRVFLPAGRKAGREAAANAAGELRGSGTVLMVDDEKTVRDFARAALEKYGYRVLAAADGLEAVRIFERDPRAVDVVLLDLRMPVLGGEEAIQAMRAARPDIKVILMSGYGEVEASRMFEDKGLDAFLQKPFTAARLAERLQAVLRKK